MNFSLPFKKLLTTKEGEMNGFNVRKILSVVFAALLSVFLLHGVAYSQGTQQEVVYSSSYANGQNLGYLEYLPVDYSNHTDSYALLVSLHGLGWRGREMNVELNRVKQGNHVAKLIEGANGRDFPFIVVSPQQPENVTGRYAYSDSTRDANGEPDALVWDTNIIDEVIERIKSTRRVDANRIYLTGTSMGGGGVWQYLNDFGGKIAAAAPIAGRTTLDTVNTNFPVSIACSNNVKNTPIWAFHGSGDAIIAPEYTFNGIQAINNCSPVPAETARFTMYRGVTHNAWDRTYTYTGNPNSYNLSGSFPGSTTYLPDQEGVNDVFAWMLTHSNGVTNNLPIANAGPNQTVEDTDGSGSEVVTLDGSASSDNNGTIVSYSWTLDGNEIANEVNPNVSLDVGTNTITLTVTDNDGASAAEDVVVVVSAPVTNQNPEVTILGDQQVTINRPQDQISRSATASDIDGTIDSYLWEQVSGPTTATLVGTTTDALTASNLALDETFNAEGRPEGYVFRVTVTDDDGATATDEVRIRITNPNFNQIVPWEYTSTQNWNTSIYQPYRYKDLEFRLLFPSGFDSTANDGQKYPLILHIHGRGENGTDNDKQLRHVGRSHRDAVQSGEFNGYVLAPQYNTSPIFSSALDQTVEIIQLLIEDNKVDPDQVYVHGLSNGGEGVWSIITRHPKVFAAASPMSWAQSSLSEPSDIDEYIHIPIWLSQGESDNRPTPEQGNSMVRDIRDAGGNIRYQFYENTGHGTWGKMYNEPDFFTWLLDKEKTDIHVYYLTTSFCPGENFSVRMGVTSGFDEYEWRKDGQAYAPGAGQNEIVTSAPGDYQVRFRRGSEWTPWSEVVTLDNNREQSTAPIISARLQSVNLPALDGSTSVELYAPAGQASYVWSRNGTVINGANDSVITVSQAGSYRAAIVEEESQETDPPGEYAPPPAPCQSPFSSPIVVTTIDQAGAPKSPKNFFASTLDPATIRLQWDDESDNENGFEIYRAESNGGPYQLVAIQSANSGSNPLRYDDPNLASNTTFYYRMRAVNDQGGSPYTEERSATTEVDNVAPEAPILSLSATSRNSVSLSWGMPNDNVAIASYNIFRDGNLAGNTTATEFTLNNLAEETIYSFTVKAKDKAGNISPASNQVTAITVNTGLIYSYYHHNNLSTVDDIEAKSTLIRTGRVDNITIDGIRDRNDRIAFIFEGFISVPADGSYTFYLSSDDGSKMFIDGQLVVNYDGSHGCGERSGDIQLTEGVYPIEVRFFENGGGQCLAARWKGPGISKQEIPASAFKDDFNIPDPPSAPSGLVGSATDFNTITLSWDDNSNNETDFEIYRKTGGGDFTVVGVVTANTTTYEDDNLIGGTTYTYQIRAININGGSTSGFTNISTSGAPAAPAAPANLTAVIQSPMQIDLLWTDNSADETGFEVYRTTSSTGLNFARIATTGPDVTSFSDNELTGNDTYYYRVRAIGVGGNSAFTATVNATTTNSSPVLESVLSRSVKFNTTLAFNISASDSEGDNLSFSTSSLPSFASFTDNGDGTGTFTFTNPVAADQGEYPITVTVNDGQGGEDSSSFTISVNNNTNPTVAAIADQQVDAGESISFSVSATDPETQGALVLSTQNLPSFATLTDNGSGSGQLDIAPSISDAGTYNNIRVIASDGNGGLGESAFTLTVDGVDANYTLSINFDNSNNQSYTAPWNNTARASSQNPRIDNLRDEEGANTGVSLKFFETTNKRWNGSKTDGMPSGLYPSFVRSEYYQVTTNAPVVMTLEGLNPSLAYNFTFFGSANTNNNRSTSYEIGSTIVTLNAAQNTENIAQITGVIPDQKGEIEITVDRTNGSAQAVLNAMIVEAFLDDGQAPVAANNFQAVAQSGNEIQLSWDDQLNNETGFEVYRSTQSGGPYDLITTLPSNTESYTDTDDVAGKITYFYQLQAVNANGGAFLPQEVSVQTPNNNPVVNEIGGIALTFGSTQNVDVSATDSDSDAITLRLVGLPAFASFSDNQNGTGRLTLNPEATDVGTYEVRLIASDAFNGRDEKTFFVTVVNNEYDELIYVNFENGSPAAFPWNNTDSNPSANTTYNNLTEALSGNASAVDMTVQAGWNGGVVAPSSLSDVYPENVSRSYWFTQGQASLLFAGLDPAKNYNISILGNSEKDNYSVTYSIGATSETINTRFNNTLVQLNGIQPNTNGEIAVQVTAEELKGALQGVISGIVIQGYGGNQLLAPTNLTAQSVGGTEINLSWQNNSENETGFEIFRRGTTGSFALLATVGSNAETYTDASVTEGNTYFYQVRAINGGQQSTFSSTALATTYNYSILVNLSGQTDPVAPAPWNNTATTPESGLVIDGLNDNENNPTDVTIRIENWGTGFDNNLGETTGNNTGVYPDAVLESFYFMEPFDPAVEFIVENLPPNMQYSFTFFGSGDDDIGVLFEDLRTEYTIGQETVILDAFGNTSSTAEIANIVPENGIVTISVRSFEGPTVEESSDFGIFNALVINAYPFFDSEDPNPPVNLAGTVLSSTELRLTWDAASDNVGVTSYRIFNDDVLTTTTANTEAVVTIPGSGNYSYTVTAIDAQGNESRPAGPVTPSDNIPQIPTALTATTQSDSEILLTWQDISDNEQGFEIFRSLNAAGSFTSISTTLSNVISYSDQDLQTNTEYFYRIRAIGSEGNSGFTSVISSTTFSSNNDPVLDNIADQVISAGETLIFDINGSDNDNDQVSFDADNLPSFGVLVNNNNGTATFTFSPEANNIDTYNILVTVLDGKGGSDSQTFNITVTAANSVPIANAGPNQTVEDADDNGSESVTLDGSGSSDSDGTIVNYSWTLDGNEIADEVSPTVSLDVGTNTITLTVTDDDGASAAEDVVIVVNSLENIVPVAAISATPTSGIAALTVDFNGSASSDSDGTIESYSWDFGDGQTATGVTVSYTYTLPGSYTAVLTVTDDEETSATDEVIITVTAANSVPIANAGPNQTVEDADDNGSESVTLDGSGSSDSDGTIVNYSWTLDGNEIADEVSPTVSLDVGTNTITLTVTDDDGASAAEDVVIVVNSLENIVPVAAISATPTSGIAALTVDFNGSASSDSDGTIESYSWDFGDGQTATGVTVSYTYTLPGSYTAVLTVTDDEETSATDEVIITVTAANSVPIANAGPNQTVEDADDNGSESVTLDGSGSSDSDGTIVNYSWTLDGNEIADEVSPTVSLDVGTNTITLTVTDDDGASAAEDVVIVVNSLVSNPNQIVLEAECATVIGGDWQLKSDGSASGGQYAVVEGSRSTSNPPNGADSRLQFNVKIGQAANYHLFARVKAPSSSSDSYWVRINGGGWIRWWQNITRGSQFNWNEVEDSPFSLQMGTNTIEFAYREDGTQLDKLQLNLDGTLPTGLGGPEGCSGVPNATIVASTTEGIAPLAINFDGSNSRDTDGSIVSYAWNFGVPGATATGAQVSYTFADPGIYTVSLTVTDNEGQSDIETTSIEVTSDEPVPGQIVIEAECATTIGGDWQIESNSSASGGQYAVVRGPISLFNAPSDSDSRLRFEVEIGQAAVYHLFARVQAPSASSDSYWLRINGGSWIRWSSGIIRNSQFNWNEVRNSPFSLELGTNTIEFAYRESGVQLDKLQLNLDGTLPTGLGGSEGCSGIPKATIIASTTEGIAPQTVNFDGSTSRDTDGSIVSYVWNFGEAGATGNGAQVSYQYATPGTYTVSLTVTDNDEQSNTDNIQVTVLDPTPVNQGPIAKAGPDQEIVDTDDSGSETVSLDGSGSSDSDGIIVSYVWTENGLQIATGVNPNVDLTVGNHTITLTVTDNDGATGNDVVLVTVDTPLPTIPEANAGSDQIVVDADSNGNENVTLDGSGSSDADGTITNYSWTENGTEIATGSTPTVNLAVGDYIITLVVTDNNGNTNSDEVSIEVQESGSVSELAIHINFSNDGFNPQRYVAPWNYTGRATSQNPRVNDLKDAEGESTGVSLKLFASSANGDRWNGSSNNGVGGSLYPAEVMDSYYSIDFWSPVTMTLEGLNPALTYDFTFYGGTNESNRMAEYQIGSQLVMLNISGNATETVSITGVNPTPSGTIDVTVTKGNSGRGVLNAMIVEGSLTNNTARIVSASPALSDSEDVLGADGEEKLSLELLPNPTSYNNIQLVVSNYEPETIFTIELVNITGNILFRQTHSSSGEAVEKIKLDALELNSGVYFMRVIQGSSIVQERLIIY